MLGRLVLYEPPFVQRPVDVLPQTGAGELDISRYGPLHDLAMFDADIPVA